MVIDLTRVLGSIVLIGGAIASAVTEAFPVEVNYTMVSAGIALWVVPPVWNTAKDFLKAMFRTYNK